MTGLIVFVSILLGKEDAMDAVYLWVGKIVVWGSGGLFLWLVLGAPRS